MSDRITAEVHAILKRQVQAFAGIVETVQRCRTCRHVLPATCRWKSCEACRKKEREKQRTLKLRRALAWTNDPANISSAVGEVNVVTKSDAPVKFPELKDIISRVRTHKKSKATGDASKKRKLPGEADVSEAKRFKGAVSKQPASEKGYQEYQTSLSVFSAIKKAFYPYSRWDPTPDSIHFRACYSIVQDKPVDSDSRAFMVSQDLARKVFGQATGLGKSTMSGSTRVFACKCHCLASGHAPHRSLIKHSLSIGRVNERVTYHDFDGKLKRKEIVKYDAGKEYVELDESVPGMSRFEEGGVQHISWLEPRKSSTPGASDDNIKVTQRVVKINGRELVKYSRSIPGRAEKRAQDVAKSTCGGTIRIRVEDDRSHPYFKGERIMIEICHS
ncbi:hypothetical protein FISHEDRAFT_56771 [Fistulina hepatica ATCC 64428]|uniref:Uncharacterized protein n=1 Tax=Fistulina hepatica ATCC 64428 TaxID=1128425 RepID=A0A0D7AKD2_9AGAR|nr:hypothetical protein FISHEDRAFT_56771 [Fistulina hepatica ATCC 64428]